MADLDEVKKALGLDDGAIGALRKLNEGSEALRKLSEESESLRKLNDLMKVPSFELPKHLFARPELDIPRIPTPKEANTFQSAGMLVKSMARTVQQWRAQLPSDLQPTVVAILQGGHQINVTLLAEESFHGIRIEGTMSDGSACVVLLHQATVQLLCVAVKIEDARPRRTIGFLTDGIENQL